MMKISVVTIVAMLAFSVVADAQKWVYRHIFSEGRASVRDAKGLWGYIDENSKMISPCNWKDAYDFKEGLAAVRDENGLYGFIDLDGKQVIPCQYKAVDSFSEGLAAVAIAKNSVYMWGYIDKTGKEIIPFNFKLALPFENGVAKVHSDQHVWLKVDKTGKFVE